jgi:hypothetical protein
MKQKKSMMVPQQVFRKIDNFNLFNKKNYLYEDNTPLPAIYLKFSFEI